jgi:hypothetical protein
MQLTATKQQQQKHKGTSRNFGAEPAHFLGLI